MEEGSRGGSPGASSSSSSALLSGGGRQRFQVELRPGETTIVSWKKLVKDANKAASSKKPPPVPTPPEPVVAVNRALDSMNAPLVRVLHVPSAHQFADMFNSVPDMFVKGESAKNEVNDAPHGSRFGTVIEKIERLYMGKNSSDEEDLNGVPDDDEYDTEDSFIDDTELDDYFKVDDSAIKHDGFFVNRGKLERTTVSQNEPTAFPSKQPKKRKRKDSGKVYGGNDDERLNNLEINDMAAGKVMASTDKGFTLSAKRKASTVNREGTRYQNPMTATGSDMKKSSDSKNAVDPSLKSISNSEAQMAEICQSKNHGSKLNQSLLMRDKNVIHEQSEAKATDITQQITKNPLVVRKEGSYTKPKSTMLEKAIVDLEKIVVESRPPSTDVTDADSSSPAVKRRMPPEIKHKLAKVARLAHASHGKISKELLNRLMNIVGHLIQLRSLRRNLKNMVNMGLSAKEEKDARMQQLKKQIDDMVKIRAPMMKSKAIEHQVGTSDDFQETGPKEKEVLKRRITMDDTLEDKICDLYDFFIEGLDEDPGPQVRKLYAELADLWPQGFMDNHGIRRAICRAKDRRKTLHRHKDQETLKRKKFVATKTNAIHKEAGSVALPPHTRESYSSNTPIRSISNTLAAASAASHAPDKPKQEKLKGNNQSGVTSSDISVKMGKSKVEAEYGETQTRQEETTSAHAEERQKFSKHITKPSTSAAATQPTVE